MLGLWLRVGRIRGSRGVLGVNRLLITISPRCREGRVAQGTFRPATRVFETTGRVIDTTEPKRRN